MDRQFDAYEVHPFHILGNDSVGNPIEEIIDDPTPENRKGARWGLYGHLKRGGIDCFWNFNTNEEAQRAVEILRKIDPWISSHRDLLAADLQTDLGTSPEEQEKTILQCVVSQAGQYRLWENWKKMPTLAGICPTLQPVPLKEFGGILIFSDESVLDGNDVWLHKDELVTALDNNSTDPLSPDEEAFLAECGREDVIETRQRAENSEPNQKPTPDEIHQAATRLREAGYEAVEDHSWTLEDKNGRMVDSSKLSPSLKKDFETVCAVGSGSTLHDILEGEDGGVKV